MTIQELGELLTSPPAGITVALADESDIYKWKVTMEGPADSPYAVSDWRFILPSTVSLLSKRPSGQSNIHLLLTSSLLQKQYLYSERAASFPLDPRLGGNGLLPNPPSQHHQITFTNSPTRAENSTSSSTFPHNTLSAPPP